MKRGWATRPDVGGYAPRRAKAEKDVAPRTPKLQIVPSPDIKTLTGPIKPRRARFASKWIPGGICDAAVTQEQAERFTAGLTAIADQIEGLPADLARHHDHYIRGLPKK